MIVIIGESASGKTTLQKMLVESHKEFKKLITYTTRPKRKGEKDGVDYHFISPEKFDKYVKNDFFIEYATYRGWNYGTAIEDCKDNVVAVLTPAGLRALKANNYKPLSVYLCVDRESRLINSLLRGDNIDESYRRNLSDVGQFDSVANEVSYVINNSNYHMDEKQVLKCMEEILKVAEEHK